MMNSSCVAGCLDAQVPLRFSFLSLYQWPDSDAEFVRVLSMKEEDDSPNKLRRRTTYESYACRQMFLRSYKFSKKETVPQKTKKYLGRATAAMLKMKKNLTLKKILSLLRKLGDRLFKTCCAILAAAFGCLLACTTSVDVKDQQQQK